METWFEQIKLLLNDVLAGERTNLQVIAGLYLAFGFLEFWFPAESRQGWRGRIRNLIFTAIYLFGGTVVLIAVMLFLPRLPPDLPDRGWLISAWYLLLYLLAIDFLFYWYHRAQHSFAWLWPIHELHHADAEVNAMTSMRTYWLELPIQVLIITLPTMLLFGSDPTAAKALPFVTVVWLFFTHANLRLRLGPLSPWICGPQVHRIHHSRLSQHRDKNFAQYFPIYDILFGTYWAPEADEFPPTGTDHLATDATVGHVIARPFSEWWRALRPSRRTPKRGKR